MHNICHFSLFCLHPLTANNAKMILSVVALQNQLIYTLNKPTPILYRNTDIFISVIFRRYVSKTSKSACDKFSDIGLNRTILILFLHVPSQKMFGI